MAVFSFIIAIFFILFFSFYKPVIDQELEYKTLTLSSVLLILKNISPFILISLYVLYDTIFYHNNSMGLFYIGLFFLFIVYLDIPSMFRKSEIIELTTYKYIRNEKDVIKKNLIQFSIFYTISLIVYLLLINFNVSELYKNIYLIIFPFIIIINFVDSKYQLINDIISNLFIITYILYCIFIEQNSNDMLAFSFMMFGLFSATITGIEFVFNKLEGNKKEDYKHMLGGADLYIIFIILMFLGIKFIPFLFLMYRIMFIKVILYNYTIKDENDKLIEFSCFSYLFVSFILFYIVYLFLNIGLF